MVQDAENWEQVHSRDCFCLPWGSEWGKWQSIVFCHWAKGAHHLRFLWSRKTRTVDTGCRSAQFVASPDEVVSGPETERSSGVKPPSRAGSDPGAWGQHRKWERPRGLVVVGKREGSDQALSTGGWGTIPSEQQQEGSKHSSVHSLPHHLDGCPQ